ncbi:MAG: hypothetical protein BWZ10_02635 [candidate division BRC1 bacterium ADurb.BinA364]|nr:MAG: hypothetical protein BWZ10_02635 [candidate division BRC1 bacterium ADurb.BinA364]
MAPIPIFCLPWSAIQIGLAWREAPRRCTRLLIGAAAGLICLIAAIRGPAAALAHGREGLGVNAREWNESALLAAIRRLSPQTVIYTNAYDLVYFQTGRPARLAPAHRNYATGAKEEDFASRMLRMREDIEEGRAVLAYFSGIRREYLVAEAECRRWAAPEHWIAMDDGAIWVNRARESAER